MKRKPQLWVLSGGNGAGKSTFYRTRLEPLGISFINADILAAKVFPDDPIGHSYDAVIIASQMCNRLLQENRSFCFESVFSHPSKVDFIANAKLKGYEVIMIFVHLENTALNIARVAQRVNEGGHEVPENKIISRVPRVLELMRKAFPLCDRVYILDNSRADNPYRQIAEIRDSILDVKVNHLPGWANNLLSFYRT